MMLRYDTRETKKPKLSVTANKRPQPITFGGTTAAAILLLLSCAEVVVIEKTKPEAINLIQSLSDRSVRGCSNCVFSSFAKQFPATTMKTTVAHTGSEVKQFICAYIMWENTRVHEDRAQALSH